MKCKIVGYFLQKVWLFMQGGKNSTSSKIVMVVAVVASSSHTPPRQEGARRSYFNIFRIPNFKIAAQTHSEAIVLLHDEKLPFRQRA